MNWRTPVFVYASDPMSSAGAKAQLMNQPEIELVGSADLDRARVALVVGDAVDEAAAKVVRAIRRDGIARVVLVASRFDEAGVIAAVAAGVTAFLRRSEATSARLVEVVREADLDGCRLPEGLLQRAAASPPPSPTPSVSPTPSASAREQFFDAPSGSLGASRSAGALGSPGADPEPRALGAAPERLGATLTRTRLSLSAREEEVLRLVAEGFDTTDIAEQLSFSESTIKGVLAKIMGRLDARNRCHVIAIVVREGLI